MRITNITDERGSSITAVHDGVTVSMSDQNPFFDQVQSALGTKMYATDPEGFMALMRGTDKVAETFTRLSERVTLVNGIIHFDGVATDDALGRHVVRLIREGKEYGSVVAFMEKLAQNPSKESRRNLWFWMNDGDREFTLTDDGDIIAYKGLTEDRTSVHSGAAFVDDVPMVGHIPNADGSVIEMARNRVNPDRFVGCSYGLHAGTWEYASSFGTTVVSVRINPRDVVSVPQDCESQKMRVCRYVVIEEISGRYESALRESPESKPTWPLYNTPTAFGGDDEVVDEAVDDDDDDFVDDDDDYGSWADHVGL